MLPRLHVAGQVGGGPHPIAALLAQEPLAEGESPVGAGSVGRLPLQTRLLTDLGLLLQPGLVRIPGPGEAVVVHVRDHLHPGVQFGTACLVPAVRTEHRRVDIHHVAARAFRPSRC